MGKNKRRQIEFYDSFHKKAVMVDSIEECDFMAWCIEAIELKAIQSFEYQPQAIKLSESIEYINSEKKKRVLFREHVYSPDFIVEFCPKSSRTLCKEFKLTYEQSQLDAFVVHLDVKGTFQRGDGGRAFSLNQKWVYQKTGVYVCKVIPKEFFSRCGCPKACFTTKKTNKPRKAFVGMTPINEALCLDEQRPA